MKLEDLNKHLYLVQQLQETKELYQAMQAKTIGSQKLDGMPHGGGVSDKTGMLATELADLGERIAYQERMIRESEMPVEEFINSIEEERTRMIFRLRFLYGLSWCEVAHFVGKYVTEESVRITCYRYLGYSE